VGVLHGWLKNRFYLKPNFYVKILEKSRLEDHKDPPSFKSIPLLSERDDLLEQNAWS
jgi:hypothetical protein